MRLYSLDLGLSHRLELEEKKFDLAENRRAMPITC